jgi:hypothetical protein
MMFERIWLQSDEEFGEISWCSDKINDDDTEYIRADINAKLQQAVNDKDQELFEAQELVDELLEVLETYANPDEWTNTVLCIGENPDGTEWEFEHDTDFFRVWNRDDAGWGVATEAIRKAKGDRHAH